MKYHYTPIGTLILPNAEKDVEQQEFSFIASGNENATATLEDTLAGSHKTKNTLTLRYNNCAPSYLPK